MKAAVNSALVVRALLGLLGVSLALASVVVVSPRPADTAAPLQVPVGFVDELVVGGLLNPRAVAWTPDGRLLILERGSASSDDENLASVRVFKNGQLLANRALILDVCGNGERGLLGIALDPGFSSNGYVYLYYSRQDQGVACGTQNTWTNGQPGPRNRVSRFTMSGDTISPASELVLLDNIPTDVGIHNAGDMAFGPDGYLYIATGDSGLVPSPAAQLDNLAGKILRIRPQASGYLTDGNPYQTASGATACGTIAGRAAGPCREIWAHGLRNPFRIGFQPGTGQLFVADVGGGSTEEVNLALAGRNYGWPTCEGRCFPDNAALTDPIYQYPHDVFNGSTDAAIIGGDFATHSSYPQPYQGGYFFADFNRGWVRYLKFENNTWVGRDFASNAGGAIIDLSASPDGYLHYLVVDSDQRTAEVRRIRAASGGGNQRPYAVISVDPSGGPLDTTYTFSAAGSGDPDNNTPLAYLWDMGDGVTRETSTPSTTYQYASAGTRTVTLRVRDSGSPAQTSDPATVQVFPGNAAPTAQIELTNLSDQARGQYRINDTWRYRSVNVVDDQPLPADALSWTVAFHHQDHTHPFITTGSGSEGQFVPNYTEWDPVQWYRVILRVRDNAGQVTEVYRDVFPQTVRLTFQTVPSGGQVLVDGNPLVAPVTVERVVANQTTLDIRIPQTVSGQPHTFSAWSQGGARNQTVTIPPVDTSYTATLRVLDLHVFLPMVNR